MAAVIQETVNDEIKDLVTVDKIDAASIFAGDGLEPLLQTIEHRARSVVFDLDTSKGRTECASIAYRVARCKTFLDGLGKDFVADLKKQAAGVDERRRKVRDVLDALKEDIRKPLDEWEAERKKADEEIGRINGLATSPVPRSVDELEQLIESLMQVDENTFCEEKRAQVKMTRDSVLTALRAQLEERREFEELKRKEEERQLLEEAYAENERRDREAKERAEREERIRQEAAEQARREAEEKAQREKEAAEQQRAEAREILDTINRATGFPEDAVVDVNFLQRRIAQFDVYVTSCTSFFNEGGECPDLKGEFDAAVKRVRAQLDRLLNERQEREADEAATKFIAAIRRPVQERYETPEEVESDIRDLHAVKLSTVPKHRQQELEDAVKETVATLQKRRDEMQRAIDEQRAREEEQRRQQDEDHRRYINVLAAEAFIAAGFLKGDAQKIVTLIARGDVPNVSIKY